jgi:hypothetical protein
MATVGYTALNPIGGIKVISWTLGNGDDGKPMICPQFADRTIQVTGTFGAGGTVEFQGSNIDPTPIYSVLNDPQGNPLVFTIAKIEQVLENTYRVRPVVTGGDVNTSLTISMLISTPTAYGNHVDSTV